jgi:hypothetical protein
MNKKYLIIDNRQDDANASIRFLNDAFQVARPAEVEKIETVLVTGRTSKHIIPLLKKILAEQWFDGVVLDILYFDGETDGGIRVWDSLTIQEKANAGKLVVVTRGDAEVIPGFAAFIKKNATALCQSAKKADKIAAFTQSFFS